MNAAKRCLIVTIHLEITFGIGNHIWYSYDGSRIFLDNGLTLTASSTPQTDMQVHGDFNSSYTKYQYNWFSQSGNSPYLIAGLRSDLNDTVLYYTWPHLLLVKG